MPIRPVDAPAWLLVEEGFTLAREHEIESILALSNGAVGVRSSAAEKTSLSQPATYVAGVFDVRAGPGSVPEMTTIGDWTDLRVHVDGVPILLESGTNIEHRRMLDMAQGIYWREWRHSDSVGRITTLRFVRFASLADRRLLVQSVLIVPENYTARMEAESRLGRRRGWESRAPAIPSPSFRVLETAGEPPGALILYRANTGRSVALAVATRPGGDSVAPRRTTELENEAVVERWTWEATVGQAVRLDRVAAVCRGLQGPAPGEDALETLDSVLARPIGSLASEHAEAWGRRWDEASVEIEGDAEARKAIRFAEYHLISAANPEDPLVSIGARALTGQSYKGHVFWDTEIYVLPFYTFTHPPAARSLLMYRYHTLPGARRKAREMGYAGALYAWESADTGDETTPATVLSPDGTVIRVLTGEQEHHISADVAYGCWQYWQATGDDEFFRLAGAEIIVETARFWARRGAWGDDGRYHIRRVIGPDEYHETVDDNAFTNVMAQWNLRRGIEAAGVVRSRWPATWKELAARLHVTAAELKEWHRIANRMYTGFDRRTRLFEQFSGYHALEEIDLASYEPRQAPMDIILGRERTARTKVIKQADVVALSLLLWNDFPRPVHERNFRYYEPRTAHGSSLSPAIHALIAARLGDTSLFERYFKQAADIDLANNMGNASGGVHIAALGGLWQAAVLGAAGLRLTPDGLALDANTPETWSGLRFPVQWRGRMLEVGIEGDTMAVSLRSGEPMIVAIADGGPRFTAEQGRTWATRRSPGGWSAWQSV
ncbi:MAG: glycoside hydrolase family 65 protein [Vicinamibacterales bacterium]